MKQPFKVQDDRIGTTFHYMITGRIERDVNTQILNQSVKENLYNIDDLVSVYSQFDDSNKPHWLSDEQLDELKLKWNEMIIGGMN